MVKKAIPALLIIVFSANLSTAASNQDALSELSDALSKMPLHAFNQTADSKRWRAPSIPSKWHLEKEASPDERNRDSQARAFGENLIKHLEIWADELVSERSNDRNLAISTDLLDLADWLAVSPGYGNYLLAARCQDIASVGIGRLLVDLTYPLSVVSALVDRLDSPWQTPEARAGVLNVEARTNLFPPTLTEASLNDLWQNGQMLLIKYSSPGSQAAFEGKEQEGFDALAQIVKKHGVKPVETPLFMRNLDFFKDDPLGAQGRPVTMSRKWDAKWHGKLVVGLESQNKRKLKALLTFRQSVGNFPDSPQVTDEQKAAAKAEIETASKRGLKIVPFQAAFSSPGEAAFAQAWQRYATKDTRNLDAMAWQAYKEITSGEFVDEDTREKRLFVQMTSTPEKTKSGSH